MTVKASALDRSHTSMYREPARARGWWAVGGLVGDGKRRMKKRLPERTVQQIETRRKCIDLAQSADKGVRRRKSQRKGNEVKREMIIHIDD